MLHFGGKSQLKVHKPQSSPDLSYPHSLVSQTVPIGVSSYKKKKLVLYSGASFPTSTKINLNANPFSF